MNLEIRSTSRIVIALEPGGALDFAFELACQLAVTTTPELAAVFIENARLLEHARSRLAREVMYTGRERVLEPTTVERQLRAQAALARSRFEAVAARLGLPHSFEIARGGIAAELARSAIEAEALVVGIARDILGGATGLVASLGEIISAAPPVVLLAREGWLSGRTIAIVIDDPDDATATLRAVARLARSSRSPIVAMLAGAAAEDRERLKRRLTASLQAEGVELRGVVTLPQRDARSIADAARACHARLVALTSSVPQADAELVGELLRRLASALMIVRR